MKPNDKVVCVEHFSDDATEIDTTRATANPVKDQIYVIHRVDAHPDGPSLFLVGMCAGHWTITGDEVGYAAEMFRRLDDIKAENAARKSKSDTSK